MATKRQTLYKATWAVRKDGRITHKAVTAYKKGKLYYEKDTDLVIPLQAEITKL